jgi:radical SAM enzyme (TIGR01210 family)
MSDERPVIDGPIFTDDQILAARGPKNLVDPWRPYAFHVEPECSAEGTVEDVATVFLTNRECPFRCLMCDLWKNTTDRSVPVSAIPRQIDFALSQLPPAQHIKLYNSGNFFDRQAIPAEDHRAIAERVQSFRTVIVESHPRLCGDDVLRFRDLLHHDLEVAMGLETAHPDVLARLNKRMSLHDFERAVRFLTGNGIHVRSFILLRPPYLDEQLGLEWALRSLQFAFDAGVRCCAVIPTRGGNGIMEQLARDAAFHPPSMTSIEQVLAEGLTMNRGRVFVDLWDCEQFYPCSECGPKREQRLRAMNLRQEIKPPIPCSCTSS